MYGSNFWSWTSSPRATRSRPIEAAAMPMTREETTPPVMKMKRVSPGVIRSTSSVVDAGHGTRRHGHVAAPRPLRVSPAAKLAGGGEQMETRGGAGCPARAPAGCDGRHDAHPKLRGAQQLAGVPAGGP